MLYATTRSKTDSYTSYRALHEDLAPDAGAYIPFRMPKFSHAEMDAMSNQSFGQTVAQLLNLFFATGLTGWDVDCCIGKNPAMVREMSHRVILVNLWNNPGGDFDYIMNALYAKLCAEKPEPQVSQWAKIAIHISFAFAIVCQLLNQGHKSVDIAVNSGDFLLPMAVWYARQMGLPVGTIVCCCNENSTPWDLLHRGEMNTGAGVIHTANQALDVSLPVGLERLIFAVFGFDETKKYLETAERKGIYQIRPDMVQLLSSGMFVSVVGKDRVEAVISSVYRSNKCVLDPHCAVSYGGLQDYRAKTGESCPTVLLCHNSPIKFSQTVQNATGLSAEAIRLHLDQT